MAITHKVFSSRNNNLNSELYVGEAGRLFYEQPATPGVAPVLKYSDGVTHGGLPLSGGSLTFSGDTPPNNPSEGNLWWSTIDGRLYIYYDSVWVDASPDVQGSVTEIIAGTGISINTSTGAVTITATVGPDDDSAYATTSTVNSLISAASHPSWSINSGTTSLIASTDGTITLSANSLFTAINNDLNILVASTSNSINIYGEFHVHAPDILGITSEPIFRVLQDGQVRVLVPTLDAYEGGVSIVGSTSSNVVPPQNLGVMLHITGQLSQPNRFYMDGNNTYNAIVGRRFGGTVTNPTSVVKDDVLLRIGGLGYTPSGFPTFQSSRIAFVAAEDHTDANQGGRIEFYTNATGTNFLARDISVDSHGITFRDNTVQDTAAIPYTQRGTSNGVATLDGGGKVPLTQLPTGAVVYKGAWDASTNLTAIGGYALSNTTPAGLVAGWQYSVSVTGTLDIGNGSDTFVAGDYVTYNGTHWDRIPGVGGSVISFNGRTGDVVMTTTDVTNVLTLASIPTNRLVTNSFTFNQGPGITVSNNGTPVVLGSSVTINNAGVTSLASLSSNITVSANTGSINLNWVNNSGYLTSGTVNTYVTPFNTGTLVTNAVNATNATTATNAAYAYSFNTGTLVTTSVTAGKVTNALTAGYGLAFSAGTIYDGSTALTLNRYEGVTGPVTVSGNAYALDLGAANGLVILNNASQANYTITISNPVAGKVVRVMCLNMKTGAGATTVTVSGLTAANSSNGGNTFQGNANGAVAIVEFLCTTTATSGVYMNAGGAK